MFCKKCGNIIIKYTSAQLCNNCYNKRLEKKRKKEECSICGKFHKCRYEGPICANCYAKYKNPEYYDKIIERSIKRSYTAKGKYSVLKAESKRRKIKLDLSFEDYEKIIKKPCHYCGEKIEDKSGGSLDRINNDKTIGYTKDNVLPCCYPCNSMRGKFLTVEEMEIAMKAILKHRKKKEDSNNNV